MNARLKCVVCGYIIEDDIKLLRCPVCGVGLEKFVPLPEPVVFADEQLSDIKAKPRIEKVINPEWIPHEIKVGRLTIEISKLLASDGFVNLTFEKDALIVILNGCCEVECEDGFNPESYLGEKVESELVSEESIQKENELKDEENAGSENRDLNEVSDETSFKDAKKINLDNGYIILVPSKVLIKVRSTGEEHLVLLKVCLK